MSLPFPKLRSIEERFMYDPFLDLLGEGTFSIVYRAEFLQDSGERIPVALKLLHKGSLCNLQALVKEVEIGKQLVHPNCLAIHGAFQTDTHVLIALELVEGIELFEWLQGKVSLPDATTLLQQLLRGVDYLHSIKRVVHRDLKLENIMVETSRLYSSNELGLSQYAKEVSCQRLVIVDFGLAKYIGSQKQRTNRKKKSLNSRRPLVILRRDFFKRDIEAAQAVLSQYFPSVYCRLKAQCGAEEVPTLTASQRTQASTWKDESRFYHDSGDETSSQVVSAVGSMRTHHSGEVMGLFPSSPELSRTTALMAATDSGESFHLTSPVSCTPCGTVRYISPETLNRLQRGFSESTNSSRSFNSVESNTELADKNVSNGDTPTPPVLRKLTSTRGGMLKRDIYGVGVIAYILFSGQLPFVGETQQEVIKSMEKGLFFSENLWSPVPEEAKDLVKKMMDPVPGQRPMAADALKHELFLQQNGQQHLQRRRSSREVKENFLQGVSRTDTSWFFDVFMKPPSSQEEITDSPADTKFV